MLRRFLIGLGPLLIVLALIDWSSSFVLPCSIHDLSAQYNTGGQENHYCPYKGGVIWAALDLIVSLKPEWWTAIATMVIGAFTCTLWLATSQQARLTREAITHAENTAKRQLRAYPGITGATIDLIEGQVRIAVVIRNFSTTPAYNFRHAISQQLCEPGPVAGFKKTTHKDMQWDMAPNSKTTMRSSQHIRDKEALALRMRDLALIFWGRVDYDDAFGKHHYIDFVYRNGPFGERVEVVRGLGGMMQERIIPHCSEPEPIYYESN
jgi:hypothetical protein